MSYPLQQTIQLHKENIYYVAHIHMEKSKEEKSCLILSSKPSSFTRRILCGSYTHEKVQRAKVLSYPLLQTIQLHKGNIMWFIYTWKSLEGKSPILSSLAIHPSQGQILCGSYTHGKVQRAKVLSYPLLQAIQLHKGNIMWFIYTWKSLQGKSPVLSSLAIHPASQG